MGGRAVWLGGDGCGRRAADVLEPRHQGPEVVADEAASPARLDAPIAPVADLAMPGGYGFFRHFRIPSPSRTHR